MSQELMTTREVARYLGVHEKQIYALIKTQRIPATRITGKWIFPRRLIDEWIDRDARKGLRGARSKMRRIEGALLAGGSNDPVLDMLFALLRKAHPELYLFSANTGSTEGLKALNQGFTDLAWSHLLEPASGIYNIPYLATYLPNVEPIVVNLFRRRIGFVVARGNPLKITTFRDLAKRKNRFINRQAGSGTRLLLDENLTQLGIRGAGIQGYDREVFTHFEVGLSVLAAEADAGIATVAVAQLFGLGFVPITTENFDMILSRSTFFEKGVQALIETIKSPDFRSRADRISGYDFSDSGKIIFSNA